MMMTPGIQVDIESMLPTAVGPTFTPRLEDPVTIPIRFYSFSDRETQLVCLLELVPTSISFESDSGSHVLYELEFCTHNCPKQSLVKLCSLVGRSSMFVRVGDNEITKIDRLKVDFSARTVKIVCCVVGSDL